MVALPVAPPGSYPRVVLGVAALADRKQPVTESETASEGTTSTKAIRMRRSPGGRHRFLGVRLTEVEERQIRRLAEKVGLSAQRFVVEAALSGSAATAAQRRRAQRDAERARLILASISNNVNQLAKWANTNHVLPDTFTACINDIREATRAVTETTQRLGAAFEPER
jgi:uncharacterized protein (DUF1778 family)